MVLTVQIHYKNLSDFYTLLFGFSVCYSARYPRSTTLILIRYHTTKRYFSTLLIKLKQELLQ